MKANEFVGFHGIGAVKDIVKHYGNHTHVTDDARMFITEDFYKKTKADYVDDLNSMVKMDDLKRLVESHELVESFSIIGLCSPENNYNPCIDYEKFGGLPMAKRELSEAIKYNSEFIEIIFDNEITLIETESLKQAILDVESCQ